MFYCYYKLLLKIFATLSLLTPITYLLKHTQKRMQNFFFKVLFSMLFMKQKNVLVNFVKQNYLFDDDNSVLTWTTDTSLNAIDGVLKQNSIRESNLISSFSVKLNSSQIKYSTSFERTSSHLSAQQIFAMSSFFAKVDMGLLAPNPPKSFALHCENYVN